VMNAFPNARPPALFSDAACYRFRVRPAAIAAGRIDVGSNEYAFTCRFSAPVGPDANGDLTQRGTCVLPSGETVSFWVNDERGGHGNGVRIYAGLRMDPFFMDVLKEVETRATRRPAFVPKGTQTLAGNHVLRLVLHPH